MRVMRKAAIESDVATAPIDDTPAPPAGSPAMSPGEIRDQRQRLQAQVAALEQQHAHLAYDAMHGETDAIDERANIDVQVCELRHQISTLSDALPEALRREREALHVELTARTQHAREQFAVAEREIERHTASMKSCLGVPPFDDLEKFYESARVFVRRRAMLASLTGEPGLSRQRDLLDEVRFCWHRQHEEREKLLRRIVHGPRSPLPATDFDDELQELLKLKQRTLHEGGAE
jgi:hypothetical protein